MRMKKLYTFEKLLEEQGYLVYTNVGMSMLPLIRQRKDIIEIRRKETRRCKKYDIILYKRGDEFILHRILKVRPTDYVVAGDHCYTYEVGVTDEQILGVVSRIIRDGKPVYMDNLRYRLYVHLWSDFYPIRAVILYFKAKFL